MSKNNVPILSYPDPHQYPGFLLWKSANKWEKVINEHLVEIGLNQADLFHLISLFSLLQEKDEVKQVDLANFAGSTTMSCSKILAKCEKKGLIKRVMGNDTRSKFINLTNKGKEILQLSAEAMARADFEFFKLNGRGEFIKYLQKI